MEQEKKSNGALFGSIVIILILLVGGIYLFYEKIQEVKNTPKTTPAPSVQTESGK
jgi:uncharacterized iron-regulated membrane protein